MPAFASQGMSDDSWKLVLFIRHLPQLTAEERVEMSRYNPKSPEDREEEKQEDDFLNGATPGKPERQILILNVFLKSILGLQPWGVYEESRFSHFFCLSIPAITPSGPWREKACYWHDRKIKSGSVTVKTRDGKSVEVKLVPSTVYISRVATADKPAALSDLAVGENVVIHATPKGDDLEADEVKFSVASASAVPRNSAAPQNSLEAVIILNLLSVFEDMAGVGF